MYGLRLRNFAFFKGFLYVLFRSRSLSHLPNSVVFLVKRKKKRKQSSVYSARARCITSRTLCFVPSSFSFNCFFLLSTDLVRITTRRVTFTVRHSFSSARSTHASPVRREVICLRGQGQLSKVCTTTSSAFICCSIQFHSVLFFFRWGREQLH